MQNNNFIITGISGFIGKNLIPFLDDVAADIYVLDIDVSDNFNEQQHGFTFVQYNIVKANVGRMKNTLESGPSISLENNLKKTI